MHPLAPSLAGLSDDEIHKKRAELNSRLMFAYQMGRGDMVEQIRMLLGDYEQEVQVRNQKLLDDMQKHSKAFKDKIDIK